MAGAAIITGKIGLVNWSTTDLAELITSWSANVTVDIHDSTGMTATTVSKLKTAGLKDWTATVTCGALEAGPTMAAGAGATLILGLTQTVSDGKLSGAAILLSYSVSQDPGDIGRITYNFQGNGTLAWAVA